MGIMKKGGEMGGRKGEGGRRKGREKGPTLMLAVMELLLDLKNFAPPAAPAAGWYGPYFLPASRAKQPYFPGSLALLSLCEHAKRDFTIIH
jgi:hypothetical protein